MVLLSAVYVLEDAQEHTILWQRLPIPAKFRIFVFCRMKQMLGAGAKGRRMRKLKILFVTAEAFPYAKTGGVADFTTGLALTLRAQGHEVRMILPRYGFISERKNRIHEIRRLKELPIPFQGSIVYTTIKSSSIQNPKAKVQVYLTTHPEYFDNRWGIYTDPDTGKPYEDNNARFIFFTLSVLELCRTLDWYPDVIHCNDWPTALLPVYLKTLFQKTFAKTRTVLTIHNIGNQGVFPLRPTLEMTGLPPELKAAFTHRRKFNFLKAGILYADALTTVSPTYGRQILEDHKLSEGLSRELQQRKERFYPILNGIDATVWNPRKDKWIAKNYDINSLDRKEVNKKALLEMARLEYREERPVVGMISRLIPEKGIDLLQKAAAELAKLDCQYVILGSGEKRYEEFLKDFALQHPDKVGVRIGFDEVLAHLITAGADLYLMPSRYEPCGLNQMYSMAYGTVPIVRATGGLVDTVEDFNPETGKGTGIVFRPYTVKALIEALERGITLYHNKSVWYTLIRNGMKQDNSWETRVKEYEKVYATVLSA